MAFDKIRIIYPQVIYSITDDLLLEILGLESIHGRFLTLFFFSTWVFFHKHSRITGLQGKGEGILLPLPPASQTLRQQPGDYCRESTSANI